MYNFVSVEMITKNNPPFRYCIDCHVRVTVKRGKGHELTGVLFAQYENVPRIFVHPASSKQLYADAVCTNCARAVYNKKRSVINIMHTFIHSLMLAHIMHMYTCMHNIICSLFIVHLQLLHACACILATSIICKRVLPTKKTEAAK